MAKKNKPPEGKKGLPGWMATYGDMVTLLLCFFVLLFATSNVDVAKYQAVAASFNDKITIIDAGGSMGENNMLGSGIADLPALDMGINDSTKEKENKEELEKLAENFRTYFAENNLSQQIDVEVTENFVKLTFDNGILFDSGSAELKQESKEALDIVADELSANSATDIKIEGHTDNIPINSGIYPDNMYLSAARSISVLNYFKGVHGIQPSRLSQEGFGEYKPIASNESSEGRAKNRRVEIKISAE
ncbi:MAG: OmpA family protein [Lachnospirales bacterium]